MNFFEKSSIRLAKSVRSNYSEAASEEVLTFSLNIFLNTVTAILLSLIVCYFTGHFVLGLLAIFSYTFLRIFSGGVHLASSVYCCILSIIIFIITTHLSYNYFFIGVILDITSIIILSFTAPSGIEQVSRVKRTFYHVLKLISISIVTSNFIFQSDILSTAFFIQSLMTTSISYKVVDFLERRGNYETTYR